MVMKKMNKKGITLIELIVVMVIIAIGAVLLAPGIGAWLPNYRLRSATRDIASTMRTAQMKAVSTNMEYRVFFPDASSYVLQYNSGGFINEGALQTIPAGVSLDLSNLPGNNAQFNPNSTSSIGSVTLTNTKGTQKTITLTPATGRVKIE
jgi:prepilin-type N-terminal cleavage/methylation domain-containing protein